MTAPLILRARAAQATVDAFLGKPFRWGSADCAHLAAFCLERLGYAPDLAQFGDYKSDRGARKALKRRGFSGVEGWLDSVADLQRTPAAFVLPGDIVGLPGDGGWTGLTVAVGNGRVLGFHAEAPERACVVVQPLVQPLACWRADPCRS